MAEVFGVISDTHNHAWSTFAETNPNGVNSRLQIILDETKRCAEEVKAAGGNTMIHCGDLFHVRGSVAPSVLNPTRDLYKQLVDSGMNIYIMAGNHDLEGKESNDLGSAVTSFRDIGCAVINEATVATPELVFVPWEPSVEALKAKIEKIHKSGKFDLAAANLFLHAGLDGVMPGLPSHGLDPAWLYSLGFLNVFCGHYHHHKEAAKRVYSVGALTHQTWADVGSKAGFLVVSKGDVKWHASRAPGFLDIDGSTKPEDVPLLVDGNYVRARIESAKSSEIEALRQFLMDSGAKGVSIIATPPAPVTRAGGTVAKAGVTLDQSVGDYIKAGSFVNASAVEKLCMEILTEVRSAE